MKNVTEQDGQVPDPQQPQEGLEEEIIAKSCPVFTLTAMQAVTSRIDVPEQGEIYVPAAYMKATIGGNQHTMMATCPEAYKIIMALMRTLAAHGSEWAMRMVAANDQIAGEMLGSDSEPDE